MASPVSTGMSADVSLGYVAAMQEHGVPVTYAYISDAHDLAGAASHTALGPGEQAYEQQLKAYDNSFAKFFARLASDGITPANTLFVFTSDEGDHFTGGPPTPTAAPVPPSTTHRTRPWLRRATTARTTRQSPLPPGPPFGEVATGLDGLLAQEQGLNNYTFSWVTTPLPASISTGSRLTRSSDPGLRAWDCRPDGYQPADEQGRAASAIPGRSGRDESAPYGHGRSIPNADLHDVRPARLLRHRYLQGGFNSTPPPTYTPACVLEEPAFAWLHGNIQPDITRTWLGMAGPGIKNLGSTTVRGPTTPTSGRP